MKLLRILAALAALAITPAVAQVTPGSGPLTIAKGGTNATTASGAQSSLGLTIGSAVQAWDADLDALAALGGTNTIYYRSGANTWTAVTIGGLLSFSGGTLNVGDAELAAIAGLTSAADKCFYFTGSGTAATFDCPSWARSVISAASAGAGRTAFGLAIGTDVQAYDAELAALAGLTSANNKCFYWTGTATAATFDCSSYGRGLINAADATAARLTLGAVIGTNVQAWDADLDAVAGLASNGLIARTGAGTAAVRTITAPAAGISVSNGDGVSGNPTLALANDLSALEALSSTGFAARTTTDTWAQRTITGTSNEVCVTNGDGVSGNPTLGICAGWLSTAHTWAGVQTFAAPITTGTFDIQGTIKASSFVTSTQITANQNNYTATDGSNTCTTKTTLRISTDASRNITGLSCGQAEGDIRIVHNVGAQAAVLTNQDASSTAANRFLFGGDLTLAADASITLRYDGVASRWRAITSPGAGGGGGGGVSSVTVAAGTGISVSGTCAITTSGTCTVSLSTPVSSANGGTGVASPTAKSIPVNQGASPQTNVTLTAGQCLTADTSGNPVAISGCRILLQTYTASNSATIADASIFTSTYNEYDLVCENLVPATTNNTLRLRVNSSGVQSTNYRATNIYANTAANVDNSTTGFNLTRSSTPGLSNSSANGGWSGSIRFYKPTNTSYPKQITGQGTSFDGAGTAYFSWNIGGDWNSTSAISGFQLDMSVGGNITSGTCKVYGML